MARRLTAHDRDLIRAVTASRPPELPQSPVPRWTHPLARLMALALGFDPDSGQDWEITTTKISMRDLDGANGSTSKTSRRRCG